MEIFDLYRPRDINLELGISDKEGTLTYHIFNDAALNGFSADLSSQREASSADRGRAFIIAGYDFAGQDCTLPGGSGISCKIKTYQFSSVRSYLNYMTVANTRVVFIVFNRSETPKKCSLPKLEEIGLWINLLLSLSLNGRN